MVFAERFAQLLKVDDDRQFSQVVWLVLKFMSANAKLWLDHHPSLQAAVAINVAVDIVTDKSTCHLVYVKRASKLKHSKELGVWSDLLQTTSKINRSDIRELYRLTKSEIKAQKVLQNFETIPKLIPTT